MRHGPVVDLRIFVSGGTSFHPKAYLFRIRDDSGVAYVESSNLSQSAIDDGVEWNYRVVDSRERAGFNAVKDAFETLFRRPFTQPIDEAWIEGYRARRRTRALVPAVEVEAEAPLPPVLPKLLQSEALVALEATRAAGNSAGLVVLATGLGKTWLAAFDADLPEFRRVLFVAHREEILDPEIAKRKQLEAIVVDGRKFGSRIERSPQRWAPLLLLCIIGDQPFAEFAPNQPAAGPVESSKRSPEFSRFG